MSWHTLSSAAIFLGKAVLIFGLVCILIFGSVAQTQERIAKYKKSRRIIDLLKIFSKS